MCVLAGLGSGVIVGLGASGTRVSAFGAVQGSVQS